MTPQQLIDLPYAGTATKQLIKQGDWDDPELVMKARAQRIMFLAEQLVEELEEMNEANH